MQSSTGKRHARGRASSRFAIRTALRVACLAGSGAAAIFASAAGYAAAASDDTGDLALQEVVVGHASIPRPDSEPPSPVSIITAADIEHGGLPSVADVVRTLSADNSGTLPTAVNGAISSR